MIERKRILVVDDDDAIRESFIDVLADEGYEVLGLPNGKEALDHLTTSQVLPHLVLLDLLMPVMDGIEFRRAQLAISRLADVPTVVLSANAQLKEKVAPLNVAAFLKKPVDLERLLTLIATLMR